MLSLRKILVTFLKFLIPTLGIGLAINLSSNIIENPLRTIFGKYYEFNIFLILVVSILLSYLLEYRADFQTLLKRTELIEGLNKRYLNRFKKKLDSELRFEINLSLRYTKTGTTDFYIKRYFINGYREKSAGDFDDLFNTYTSTLKRLLIIGEAGAGKTVLLLKFAQSLLALANNNPDYPIPIILNLSSWRDTGQSFTDWLEQNLIYAAGEYGASKQQAKLLASQGNIILLLDGLDEIPKNHRNSCLTKLYDYLKYIKTHQSKREDYPELIICCRRDEYSQMATNAPVQATVAIQDITPKILKNALNEIRLDKGFAVDNLLMALKKHDKLNTMLTSAFYIHLALKLANDENFDFASINGSLDLVNSYINDQIKSISNLYNPSKVRKWLSWLAYKILSDKEGLSFELADLKVGVINVRYSFLIVRIVFGLLIGYTIGGVLGRASYLYKDSHFFTYTLDAFRNGYFYLIGMSMGIYFAYISIYKKSQEILSFRIDPDLLNQLINLVEKRVIQWFIAGFFLGALLRLRVPWFEIGYYNNFVDTLLFLVLFGTILSAIFGVAFTILVKVTLGIFSIKPYPKISNPYQRLYSPFLFDIFQALVVFLIYFPYLLLLTYIPYIKVFATIKIYSGKLLLYGIIFAFLLALLTSPLAYNILLRILLYVYDILPLRLVTFLGTVSKRTGLMEKDGGQWRFRHQLIQDLLANDWKEKRSV